MEAPPILNHPIQARMIPQMSNPTNPNEQLDAPDAQGVTMRQRLSRIAGFGNVCSMLQPSVMASVVARIDPRTERSLAMKDGAVAIIGVRGSIIPREDRYSAMYGEVGCENVAERVRVAVEDKRIKAVVLDVDSGGGSVEGVTEAANLIRSLRGKKPIIAHADWTMCSAAYWLCSGADEICAAPSATVGACGVITMAVDEQKFWSELGITYTPIAEPADKADGWGMWPNSEKYEPRLRQYVKDSYAQFTADVVAGRGVDKANFTAEWAGVYSAKRAQLLGMVDKVRAMSETFAAYTANNATGMQATRARKSIDLLKAKGNKRT